jgi:endonuclease YncB( thermonuclease family)
MRYNRLLERVMRYLLTIFFSFPLLLPDSTAFGQEAPSSVTVLSGRVVSVPSGGTIELQIGDERHIVTILGVSAASIAEPAGDAAQARLVELSYLRAVEVRVRTGLSGDQIIGEVWRDGINIGERLILEGYVFHDESVPNEHLATAQDQAMSARRGMWSSEGLRAYQARRKKSLLKEEMVDNDIAMPRAGYVAMADTGEERTNEDKTDNEAVEDPLDKKSAERRPSVEIDIVAIQVNLNMAPRKPAFLTRAFRQESRVTAYTETDPSCQGTFTIEVVYTLPGSDQLKTVRGYGSWDKGDTMTRSEIPIIASSKVVTAHIAEARCERSH